MRIILVALAAYLIGCVPIAQFVARMTTGKPWGPFAETVAGFAKGFIVIAIFQPVPAIHQALILTALLSGDQWPIWNRESGRLGLAAAGGAMTALTPVAPLVWGVLWGVGFVATGYRTVGRVAALALFWVGLGLVAGWPIGLVSLPACFMILAKSRDDLKRLKLGVEPKHHWRPGT
jgi:glycerol-3-phosphate acyltransferase PlsY